MRRPTFAFRLLSVLLVTVLMALFIASCKPLSGPEGERSKDLPPAAAKIDERLVSANTEFALGLYKHLALEDESKNICISPASISLALSMTYNGADGDTKDAMAKTLALEGMTLDEVNEANKDLMSVLQNPDPKVELALANSIWARRGMNFKEGFIKGNEDYYRAGSRTLDFGSPDAPKAINDWVSKNTRGKIERIVDKIDDRSVMFLINAVYFKGAWAAEFDPKRTENLPFIRPDGSKKPVAIMFRTGSYPYYEGEGFKAVRIPYGDGRIGMYVFLPDEGTGLSRFYERLDPSDWNLWIGSFSEKQGRVGLPRFKMEFGADLKEALSEMGMGIAFDEDRADFGLMCERMPGRNVYMAGVKHKTFIEVNEKGTEAAGSTSVEMGVTGVPTEAFDFVADRPFFFAIRDEKTGAVLFMGSVNEPE